MIPPQLIVFGVIALIRLARASDKALAQYARDRAVKLPGIETPDFSDLEFTARMIESELPRIEADKDLKTLWDNFRNKEHDDPEHQEAATILFGEAMLIAKKLTRNMPGLGAAEGKSVGSAYLISQWRTGMGPPHPLSAVVLTVVDIGLEFVAREPSVLGLRKGEALVGAFAGQLAALLEPEKDGFDFRKGFGQRAIGLFLRAALNTLHDNTELLVTDADWRKLVQNTLKPVIDFFPSDDEGQLAAEKITDLLLGPVFKAAVDTIAESPTAFLGDGAALGTLPGVVIGAILSQAKDAKTPLTERFTGDGIAALGQAVLGALAANAGVIHSKQGKLDDLARGLIAEVLGTLAKEKWSDTVFSRDLGLKLAAAALTAIKNGAPALFDQKEPWKALSAQLLEKVVDGLIAGASGKLDVKSIVWAETFERLGRIFLEQAAKTPAMIAGDNAELGRVVTAVAKAMAADTHLLLGRDGWLSLAALVAAEAAANPGRLFGVPLKGQVDWVGEAVLMAVLAVASKEFETRKATSAALLFGPTLLEVLTHTFTTVSGNFEKLASAGSMAAIEDTLKNILAVVDGNPRRFGSREFLRIFKFALPKALATGSPPPLALADIEALLSKANA